MTQGHGRWKWIFLSVLTLVAGGLGVFAIWAFAIRSDDAGPGEGPAAPLTQQERESLERFHLLARNEGIDVPAREIEETCREVTAIVQTTPFSPYETSVYAGSGAANRWSPLPDTAHWAAASDLEALTGTGRFLRQLTLRSLTQGSDDADGFASAERGCYEALFPALTAATA
jgi:hypothetical protein